MNITPAPLPARRRTARKRWAAVYLAVGMVGFGTADVASAGRNDPVDPALMQPALNDSFGPWECWRSGRGIVCDGARDESWAGAATGLDCDGAMIYSTGTNSRTQRRFGDESGLALRTRQHVDIRETFSLSADGTGPTVRSFVHLQHHFEYLIPGDLSSRTETFTGVDVHNTAPGVGVIVHDVGLKTLDIDGNVLAAHGPHDVLEDFAGSLAKLCDALS